MLLMWIKNMKGGSILKKLISIIICLILLINIQATPAFAENITNVSSVIDSNKLVTISGIISSGAGHAVTVRILDPKGNIEYLNSTVSTSWGNFNFSYTMKNTTAGRYDVTINASGISSPVKSYFDYGTDNSLKALSISSGSFDNVFSPEITQYTSTVDSRIRSIMVTSTVRDSTAGVKVNNNTVSSGTPSSPIMLNEGTNTINVVVTALNGNTKTYTITVTRQKTLSSSLTANASIDAGRQVTVSGTVSSGAGQLISIMIMDPGKNIEYAGETISMSGGSFRLSYTLSNNVKGRYNVTVSALGLTQPVTAYFDYGTDAGLKNLSINSDTLSPAFSTDVTSYTASAASSINSITVTPTANDSSAVIKINDTSTASGSISSPISLNTGTNTIIVVVTAQDGVTSKTYTVTVNKAAPVSSSVSVKAEIDRKKQVTIDGTVNLQGQQISVMVIDPKGNIEYVDTTTSGIGGTFLFSYNMLNDTRGRYNVTVGALSLASPAATYFIYDPGNADLRDLVISGGSLTPQFTADKIQYSVSVGYSTSSIMVTPTTMDPGASVKVNNITVTSGNESGAISLNVGDNTVRVVVTSQDGTATKTYIINIVRREKPQRDNPPPQQPPQQQQGNPPPQQPPQQQSGQPQNNPPAQ